MKEVLNEALAFTAKICLQESKTSKSSGKLWHNGSFLLLEQDQVT